MARRSSDSSACDVLRVVLWPTMVFSVVTRCQFFGVWHAISSMGIATHAYHWMLNA